MSLTDSLSPNHVCCIYALLIEQGIDYWAFLGIAATSRNAIMSLRKQGRALQLGFTGQGEKGEISMPIDMIVLMELQLIGTLGMPAASYPGMLQMVQAGKLSPQTLVTSTVKLDDATKTLEEMTDFRNRGVTIIKY